MSWGESLPRWAVNRVNLIPFAAFAMTAGRPSSAAYFTELSVKVTLSALWTYQP